MLHASIAANTLTLDYLLNQTGRRFEVLNFGTPGYGTDQIFLQFMDEENIEKLVSSLGKERPFELLLKRGVQPSYEAAKWYLTKVLGTHSGWFSSAVNESEGTELIHMSHPFGKKWSRFLKGYFGSFFWEVLEFNPEVRLLSASVTFTVILKDVR